MPTPVISIFEGQYELHIKAAVDRLLSGGIVVVPTETVYGAVGLLDHPAALERLRSLHPSGDEPHPLTIHLAKPDDARAYLGELNEFALRCIRKLWPGPVLLEFSVPAERRKAVAQTLQITESDIYRDDIIALRCPDNVVATDVLVRAGRPAVAVRAGSTVGGDGVAVAAELDKRADLVLDAGPPRFSKPSTIVRVKENSYEVLRTGIYDQRIIERLLRTTILFVCSGNTCRSPMAEAIARKLLADQYKIPEAELENKGVAVISAGAMAMPGSRATPAAVEAVRDLGADLSRHRSRMLSVELIHQADQIFTMGRAHARAVTALVPSAADKVATLDPRGDIEDPIGGDASLYQELAGELRTLIEKRLQEKPLL